MDEDRHNSPVGNEPMTLSAALYTSLLCIMFGANAVAIKISLTGLGVFTTAFMRFSIAVVIIFCWAKMTGQPISLQKGQMRHLWIVGLIFAVQLSMFYGGLSRTYASRGALIINLLPFFVLFLAHFFIPGDRFTIRKLIGILLAFIGVSFMFLADRQISSNLRSGDLMILFTALIWSCNTIYVKRIISNYDPIQIVFYPMLIALPFFLFEAILWDIPMVSRINYSILASLFFQGVVVASFGFIAWNHLLKKYGATSLHSFVFVMPISGVTLSGLILGEPLTANLFLALGFICIGIIVVNLKAKTQVPIVSMGKNN